MLKQQLRWLPTKVAPIQKYIEARLQARKDENNFRSLQVPNHKIDFTSNDYLGFARDAIFRNRVERESAKHQPFLGSTGSRLLSGNNQIAAALEKQIAGFHNSESALLFNSGFDANYGLLSSLPYKEDLIVYDELCHASIHDGCRAGKADALSFKHNDSNDLEEKLKDAKGLKFVVAESIYSMDGDFADLKNIAAVCKKYEAGLIVDEAHATGIIGEKGEGLVQQLHLETDCLARIHTFGKAAGSFGAVILGTEKLRDFLINYCRPFIFSTALPPQLLLQIKCAYDFFPAQNEAREKLKRLADLLQTGIAPSSKMHLLKSTTPVQSLLVKGNGAVKELAVMLQQQGFDVRPILYPTVARNAERIRICLHSFNTEEEVKALANAINSYFQS